MSAQFQTFAALFLVAVSATWLVLRAVMKRKNPGCGGDCGCDASEVKARAARIGRP